MRPSALFEKHEAALADAVAKAAAATFPGARVRAYDRLRSTGESGEPGEVYGAYFNRAGLPHVIAWSLRSNDPVGTLRHEGLHYLRRSGLLDEKEWSTLAKAAEDEGWAERHDIGRTYPHLSEDLKTEEAVAEEFRLWRRDKGNIGPKLPEAVRGIFYRLDLLRRRIAAGVRRVLGRGVTADDVFAKIESGEVGQRALKTEGAETEAAAPSQAVPRPALTRQDMPSPALPLPGENGAPAPAEQRGPAIERTDQGEQHVLPGAGQVTKAEVAASKRPEEKALAELGLKGPKRANRPQEGAGDLPLFGGERQKDLLDLAGPAAGKPAEAAAKGEKPAPKKGEQLTMFQRAPTPPNTVSGDRDRILRASNRSVDFGSISPEVARATGMKPLPIRLKAGYHDVHGQRGFGFRHIEEGAHGPAVRGLAGSADRFVERIAANFNQIWQRGEGNPVLVWKGPEPGNWAMAVELKEDPTGRFYNVQTAYPAAVMRGKLLWDGLRKPQPESGARAPFDSIPATEPGEAIRRKGQGSADNVAPERTEGKGEPDDTAFQRARPEAGEVPPEGKDAVDHVAEEIAAATRASGPGPYARTIMQSPIGGRGAPYHFNIINKDFTAPANLARMDPISAKKWAAEQARTDTARTTLHDYREMLPTYLSAKPDELARLSKVEELDRLQERVRKDTGRAIVARNDDRPKAALTRLGETVILDTPRLREMYFERRRVFDKAWADLMGATAAKLGWRGAPDQAEILKAAGAAFHTAERRNLQRIAALVGGMQAQERKGYVPLLRHGDYFVSVRPKPGFGDWDGNGFPPVEHFALLDSKTPLEKIKGGNIGGTPKTAAEKIAELRKTYPESQFTVEHGYMFAKPDALRSLDIPAIEKLLLLVGNDVRSQLRSQVKAGLSDKAAGEKVQALYDQMVDTLLDQMYEEMKAGFKKRASQTPGYSTDFARSTGVYLNWLAAHVADLRHGDEIRRIDENDVARHPDRLVRDFWDEWNRRNDKSATLLDAALRNAKQAAFYWTLGANAASTVKIMTHGPLLGLPTLGAGIGQARAMGAYAAAAKDALRGLSADRGKGLTLDPMKAARTPAERAFLAGLERTSTIHHAGADELAQIRQSGEQAVTPQRKLWARALDIWGSNVAVADRMNRIALGLAAFRGASGEGAMERILRVWGHDELFNEMVRREGLSPENFARFIIDRAAGMWGADNRLPALRGRWGSLVGQFKSYELNYLSTLHQLMHRLGPEGKVAATMMLGGLWALGGAAAFPFVDDAKKAAALAAGWVSDVEPDIEASLARAMEALGFDDLSAEAVLHGLSRSLFGVDLGSGIGFGDILSKNAQSAIDLAGPATSILAGAAYKAMQRHGTGQAQSAVASELLPNALKNLVRGAEVYPEQGVRTLTGRQVLTPEQVSESDRNAAMLGFQPASVARAYEERGRLAQLSAASRHATGALVTRIANLEVEAIWARRNGDMGKAAEIEARRDAARERAIKSGAIADPAAFAAEVRKAIADRVSPEARQMKRVPKAARPEAANSPYVRP